MTQPADNRSGVPAARLYRQTLVVLGLAGVVLIGAVSYATSVAMLGVVSALTSAFIYMAVAAVTVSRIIAFHPHSVFGWPNTVTLGRTVLAALIAGYTAEVSLWQLPPSDRLAWTFAGLAASAVILDGLDGYLARRIGPRSAFGARFDMESDALLVMILSVLAAVLEKAGAWVLMIGALRYLFVAASYAFPWIDRPLPASYRRKTVCVVQGVALSLLAAPAVDGQLAVVLAASALGANLCSFTLDLIWLFRHRDGAVEPGARA